MDFIENHFEEVNHQEIDHDVEVKLPLQHIRTSHAINAISIVNINSNLKINTHK